MKVGDRVICIDDGRGVYPVDLTKGKIYSIIGVEDVDDDRKVIRIVDDGDREFGYYENRFVNLKDYRKLKLNKIKSLMKSDFI